MSAAAAPALVLLTALGVGPCLLLDHLVFRGLQAWRKR